MLHTRLAALDAQPLDSGESWLVPALLAAALAGSAVLALVARHPLVAAALLLSTAVAAGLSWAARRRSARLVPVTVSTPDIALVGSALALSPDPAALTDGEGSLVTANEAYGQRFAGAPRPLDLGANEAALAELGSARALAWRDGQGSIDDVATPSGPARVEVQRVGALGDLLLWRFPRPQRDFLAVLKGRATGPEGEILGRNGVLSAVTGPHGELLAANRLLRERAGVADDFAGLTLGELLQQDDDGRVRLSTELEANRPLRLLHIPIDAERSGQAGLNLLFDTPEAASLSNGANLQALLDILPVGLALVDRDRRFLTTNKAFRTAGGLGDGGIPAYPGDLVVKEDKAAVADTVRRNTRGPAMSSDLAVRLVHNPGEPVALTIAGLRGLGDPVVLLLLKDNSEEAKLKRQIAQATKMQAVGQLAGGVAHDFNNILTAIIGHCDLMLMRHTPGDSDYDDIQQIKSNSNRAAGLTRQLLAFSRQQTLRPQVLQLPDVVSEVSHLLKRLLGETVTLHVKHGRDLGPVRADPGQLEQVIVNLAVNARDAMQDTGNGQLTIQTYSVPANQVAELGSEILPVADYAALSIADTGCGIPANVLGKIFEPFFTTKEVGKGTGLGLSTVYGIVKQSGGYIFADSKVGQGTTFVIYLPVHREEAGAEKAPAAPKAPQEETWGSGTVLLVEDEAMVRTVAERALTRQGYTVVTANNGEEALEIIERGDPIDLLISDVVMPAMDGPTMVRHARTLRPDVPVLFMSGYAEEQLRNSIDIDHVAFLPKPFSVQELAEAARKVLAQE
ncbi:response regulator [Sphingomonas sp. BN140010]|uniref:histidine kinase n=1 Tax=Sphingomonas arvum TaxID=2992113 RepID=A0ABT3JHY8_9SPHN|nr:response regulator [Sphingomonas sp. BN140010]MCW3798698.1 response regulator [Sphingomonas sp. BN140010]